MERILQRVRKSLTRKEDTQNHLQQSNPLYSTSVNTGLTKTKIGFATSVWTPFLK